MKETDFIRQNERQWRALEQKLKKRRGFSSHEKLGENFVQLSEDLSYAQTYYPRRTVRLYLNGLAQRMYTVVFNTRFQDKKSAFRFWTHELPTALWESRLEMGFALLSFLLAAFIGIVSSGYDDGFAAQILGTGYINLTEENIAKGDPMGVYKDMDFTEMFFYIMYNNLQVSVFTFVLGVLFGVGTLGIIFRNGVMLGVFQYFFVQRDLGFESFLTIWQHGTIEIASIVVAGGAGLVLGKSILFPGTLPRSVSFKYGFLKGLKVLLGVAPLIVIAAFIESFYTRFDDLPVAFRIFTILLSVLFVLGYYVILPWRRGRNRSLLKDIEDDFSQSHISYQIDHQRLRNPGEILNDALIVVQQKLSAFLLIAALPSIILSLAMVFIWRDVFSPYFYFTPLDGFILDQLSTTASEVFKRFSMIGSLFSRDVSLLATLLTGLLLTWINVKSAGLYDVLYHGNGRRVFAKFSKSDYVLLFTVHVILLMPFRLSGWYAIFYIFLLLPVLFAAAFQRLTEQQSWSKSMATSMGTLFSHLPRHLIMVLFSLFFSVLVSALVQSPLLFICFELANDFIGFSETAAIYWVEVVVIFVTLITYFSGLTFLSLTSIMNYQSQYEINHADLLKNRINQLTIRRGGDAGAKSFK